MIYNDKYTYTTLERNWEPLKNLLIRKFKEVKSEDIIVVRACSNVPFESIYNEFDLYIKYNLASEPNCLLSNILYVGEEFWQKHIEKDFDKIVEKQRKETENKRLNDKLYLFKQHELN